MTIQPEKTIYGVSMAPKNPPNRALRIENAGGAHTHACHLPKRVVHCRRPGRRRRQADSRGSYTGNVGEDRNRSTVAAIDIMVPSKQRIVLKPNSRADSHQT
jgi:hypothetical protein